MFSWYFATLISEFFIMGLGFVGAINFLVISRKRNIKPLIPISMTFLTSITYFFCEVAYLIYNDKNYLRYGSFLNFLIFILLLIGFNSAKQEQIGIWKIIISLILLILYIFLILRPNNIILTIVESDFKLVIIIDKMILYDIMLEIGISYILLLWSVRMYIKAPLHMKNKIIILIIGVILLNPVNFLLYTIGDNLLSWFLANITMFIGFLIVILIFSLNPDIIRILPFTVHRLIIVHIPSGFHLFEHRWTDWDLKESLLSGCIHSLRNISLNILQMGEIIELKLEKASMICNRRENFISALFVSNYSKFLINCLKEFSDEFHKIFKHKLKEPPVDPSIFQSASEIVKNVFRNIPHTLDVSISTNS
ncbi:MAG: hypothetical protein ACTSVV_05265 [Promethearchaeota archaeon]